MPTFGAKHIFWPIYLWNSKTPTVSCSSYCDFSPVTRNNSVIANNYNHKNCQTYDCTFKIWRNKKIVVTILFFTNNFFVTVKKFKKSLIFVWNAPKKKFRQKNHFFLNLFQKNFKNFLSFLKKFRPKTFFSILHFRSSKIHPKSSGIDQESIISHFGII